MASETLPAKRLENALTKLQDAQSALKLAAEELAIVDAEMIGSDAHRRLIVEASKEDPIKVSDDIESHRLQSAEIAQACSKATGRRSAKRTSSRSCFQMVARTLNRPSALNADEPKQIPVVPGDVEMLQSLADHLKP